MRVLLLIGLAFFLLMTMLAPVPWMISYIVIRLLAAVGIIVLVAIVLYAGSD